MQAIDLADPRHREVWFSHPVVGDPSYDAFERDAGNPVYVGSPPYEWPVNGFLFRNPQDGCRYCWVSLYPKGYWPAGPAKLLRSKDNGQSWEDLGLRMEGSKDLFDGDGVKPGATLDCTVVMDNHGCHVVYGWAKPDNSDGGLSYAFAKSPEGPFVRDMKPFHAESAQPMLPFGYKRVYAGTLVRRNSDWLVLASMSPPGNAGGMWAFIAMTASSARGLYSPPVFLRMPQDGRWHPAPMEFFPAFVHEGMVYACLTSVAANRGYQLVLRADIEEAHRPEAWSVWESGSLFHAEPNEWEAHGIWGQSFSGFVGEDDRLHVMYPSRNADGVGTINFASRPWSKPFQNGFWVSAPNGPSLALALRDYRNFRLEAILRAEGDWRLVWNFRGPLGPDRPTADALISPLTWRSMTALSFSQETWELAELEDSGQTSLCARSTLVMPGLVRRIVVEQRQRDVVVELDGATLCRATLTAIGGAVGLVAEKGSYLYVSKLLVEGVSRSGSWFLLPLEGRLGAASIEKAWEHRTTLFRYGDGYVGDFEGARAKWNFTGRRVRLWSPRGPSFGEAEVLLDAKPVATLSLTAGQEEPSRVVWESRTLTPGNHALMTVRRSGGLPVDCAEFVP